MVSGKKIKRQSIQITIIGGQPKKKPAFRPGSFEADGSGWRYDKTTQPAQ
jgi:hypothetical protein